VSIASGIIDWIDERYRIRAILRPRMDEPIPGGAKLWYILGSSTLFVFVLQAITGVFLTIYYVPTPDHAYESIKYIDSILFGWFIRGIHHWGASAMVILVTLHMLRVFVWGAYKKPREFNWVSGVILLSMVLAMAFTGYLLPWDQKAYWATQVGTSIAGTPPVIGPIIEEALRGGTELGALSLSRFFSIHTMIIPGIIALFIGFHLLFLVRAGPAGNWNTRQDDTRPFYPYQTVRDAIGMLAVFLILIVLARYVAFPLAVSANPPIATFIPRPDWYFLFLFQLLKMFPGRLEIIGTTLIPAASFIILLIFPFIDRNTTRDPFKRPISISVAGIVALSLIMLTVMGFQSIPSNGYTIYTMEYNSLGERINFTEGPDWLAVQGGGCAVCHGLDGMGGKQVQNCTAIPPDIRYQELTGNYLNNDTLIARAITHGIDENGEELDACMPRWHLEQNDLVDLIAYMKTLGIQEK
jgi:ubiquinol-cytochrome c reductase cytochrome b subunit